MKKFLILITALVIPIACIRIADIMFFIDWETGYVTKGGIIIRIGLSLIVILLGYLTGIKRKRTLKDFEIDIESTNSSIERSSVPAGIFFFIAGFATASAAVGMIFNLISSGEINNVLMSKQELVKIGSSRLYYILLLTSIVLSVFVAFWHMLVGSWYFRGEGHFAGGRFISIFVAVWYYIRVINDFIRFPINPSNTTSLALIFSVLILSLFYTKFTKVVSVDFPMNEDPPLFCFGLAAFLWVAGIGAPTAVIIFSHGEPMQLFIIAADFFAAVAALFSLFARVPAESVVQYNHYKEN